MKMQKKLKYLLCLFSLFFFACSSEKQELEKREQILYTAMPKKEYHLIPNHYEKNDRALITQLWEGLTELKDGGVRFIEVTDIQHSQDFLTWTFHLRDDLTWSNGEKITAESYRKSWLDSLKNSPMIEEKYRMFVVKNAEKFSENKVSEKEVGIQVKDNVLEVTLNTPIPNFDEWVSNPIFYPLHPKNETLKEEDKIVNAAFKIASFQENKIILEKNEDYWDAVNTRLKKVDISLVEDGIMAYEMFPRYEIDIFGAPFYEIPFERLKQVNTLPEKLVFPVMKYYYISIPNENKERFLEKSNVKLRELLYAVSDPEFMGRVILQNDSPSIFPHPHPSSEIITKSKEEFENLQQKENFVFSESPYVAKFDSNSLLEKKLLLSTLKEWISSFKFPIRVTSEKEAKTSFEIKNYLVGTNQKEDFYYYISKKYGKNLKTEEEFLKDLPVIPLLQENTSLLLHSDIQGLSVAPSGDIYLKYIVII